MRIFVVDTICCEIENQKILYHVLGITDGTITMVELYEAGNLRERSRSKTDYLKYTFKTPNTLKPLKARVIHVDECGFVYDPGFKEK